MRCTRQLMPRLVLAALTCCASGDVWSGGDLTSDVTDHAVVFSSGHATLANLVGKDIQLEIVLDRAAVYTVGFRQH